MKFGEVELSTNEFEMVTAFSQNLHSFKVKKAVGTGTSLKLHVPPDWKGKRVILLCLKK